MGISLCTGNALAAGNGQHRIAKIHTHTSVTILQIVVLTNFTDRGPGTVHLRYQYIFGTILNHHDPTLSVPDQECVSSA